MADNSWRNSLLGVLAATLIVPGAFAAQRSFDKTLSAPPGGRLTLRTDVGSVVIVGRDSGEVVIHARIHGPDSFADHVHITAEDTPSGVTISARADDLGSFHLFSFHWFGTSREGVRFLVDVPRDYPVDLRTSGGDILVRDLSAPVRASTSGGDARIQRVEGRVDLGTSGGDASLRALAGTMDVHTGGGDIRARQLTGPARMSSAGGDMRIEDSTGSFDLRSGGGDITLLLPQNTHGSIDAESGGGSITTHFPLTVTQIDADTHLAGTLGGGGGDRLTLYSSGGDIDIGTAK